MPDQGYAIQIFLSKYYKHVKKIKIIIIVI